MTDFQQNYDAIAQLSSQVGISFTCDPEILANVSKDFGNLIHGQSRIVVQPRNTEELTALLRLANQENLIITTRGGGASQSGQSVSQGGITLDTSRLDAIKVNSSVPEPDSRQVSCGSGTTWRQLVAQLGQQELLPRVMPLNLNLTVGGTLSAGGFGANSHRFGPVVSNVVGLEVVTGSGDLVSCNSLNAPDIYEAALGGLGRCSVITSATLILRPVKLQVRTYYLLYENINTWLKDQHQLARSGAVDYLEGFCSASVQGLYKTSQGRRPFVHWLYGLHVGVEFDPSHPPITEEILDGLSYSRLLHIEEDITISYAARYDARFQGMQQTDAWRQPHPWFECFLPLKVAGTVIPQVLDLLPSCFGDGHRLIVLAERKMPRFFMEPEQSPVCLFAVLPTAIPKTLLPAALAALSEVNELVIRSGGKRYLSGWLGTMTPHTWRQHFGHQYEDWLQVKQSQDPNNVLRSALFP